MDGHLRKLFRENLPGFHWLSVETGATASGAPDSNYCGGGFEGWIEFKLATGWRVHVRPMQVGWLERRARAGGRVFVAVRRKVGKIDSLYLFDGLDVNLLRLNGLQGTPALGIWDGGPGRWDWAEVNGILRRE
jgi:hypothetical protein